MKYVLFYFLFCISCNNPQQQNTVKMETTKVNVHKITNTPKGNVPKKVSIKYNGFLGRIIYYLEDTTNTKFIFDSLIIDEFTTYYKSEQVTLRKTDDLEVISEVHKRVGTSISLDEYVYVFVENDTIRHQRIPKNYSHDVLDTFPILRNTWRFKWKWKENILSIKSIQKDKNIKYSFDIPLIFSEESMQYEIDYSKAKEKLSSNDYNRLVNDECLLDYFKPENH